jgi:hypothetical protein
MIERLAALARIDAVTTGALLDALPKLDLAAARRHAERFDRAELEQGTRGMLFNLLVALLQLPQALERHRQLGIEPVMSRRTFSDLAVWCLHHRKRAGQLGLTVEILDWSQHHLRGELLRVGALQFEPAPFRGPPGLVPPGTALLEIHIPADTRLSLDAFFASGREAIALFERLKPGLELRGFFGEAWLLDPQVLGLLPEHQELARLQKVATLFPGRIPEAKTIRRLFGPDATRADVVKRPRERLSALQRSVAQFLADPENALKAHGGLWLGRP